MRELPVRSLLIALLMPCIAVFAGCNLAGNSGDDNPDDGGTGSGALTESDNGVAVGISSTAVEMLSAMFNAVSEVDQPAGALRWTRPEYNAIDGIWTMSDAFSYDDPDADGAATIHCAVQFLANGVPQQYMDETTTHLNAWITDATNAGNYHPQGKTWDVDYDWSGNGELHAAVNGDVIDITGEGSLNGTTWTHIGSLNLERSRTASWSYELSMPYSGNGCPAGTFGGTIGADYTFSGNASNGSASWSVSRNGTVVANETGEYDCGDSGTGTGN